MTRRRSSTIRNTTYDSYISTFYVNDSSYRSVNPYPSSVCESSRYLFLDPSWVTYFLWLTSKIRLCSFKDYQFRQTFTLPNLPPQGECPQQGRFHTTVNSTDNIFPNWICIVPTSPRSIGYTRSQKFLWKVVSLINVSTHIPITLIVLKTTWVPWSSLIFRKGEVRTSVSPSD